MMTASQLESYRTYGFAAPIRVLSVDEAARYRASCDELERALGGNPRTIEVRQMHLHFRWAHELAVHPRIVDAVAQALGPNILVWATELFAKRPGDPNLFIAWHRDSPYMGFDPALTASAWVSLAHSHRANGCLQVVLERDRRTSPMGRDSARKEPGPGVPPDQVTDVVLEPGEMSMHDIDVYHGSGPNLSDDKRVGFAIRYVTPEARPLAGKPCVVVARGRDTHGHFEVAPPPEPTSTDAAVRELRKSAMQHFDAMLYNLKHLR